MGLLDDAQNAGAGTTQPQLDATYRPGGMLYNARTQALADKGYSSDPIANGTEGKSYTRPDGSTGTVGDGGYGDPSQAFAGSPYQGEAGIADSNNSYGLDFIYGRDPNLVPNKVAQTQQFENQAYSNFGNLANEALQTGAAAQNTGVGLGAQVYNAGVVNNYKAGQTTDQQLALADSIAGKSGESAAQAQLQSGLNQSEASNIALARSGRGWGQSGAAMGQAIGANAAAGQNAELNSTMLREQEQQAAAGIYGQAAGREQQAGLGQQQLGIGATQTGYDQGIKGQQLAGQQYQTGVGEYMAGENAQKAWYDAQHGADTDREQIMNQQYGIASGADTSHNALQEQKDSRIAGYVGTGIEAAGMAALMLSDTRVKKEKAKAEGVAETLSALGVDRDQSEFDPAYGGGPGYLNPERAPTLAQEADARERGYTWDDNRGTFVLIGAPVNDLRDAQGYTYRYKNPEAPGQAPGVQTGPMAQDLENTAARGAVRDTPNGKVVDTGRLSLVNTAAIGEQQRAFDDLAAEVAALKAGASAPKPAHARAGARRLATIDEAASGADPRTSSYATIGAPPAALRPATIGEAMSGRDPRSFSYSADLGANPDVDAAAIRDISFPGQARRAPVVVLPRGGYRAPLGADDEIDQAAARDITFPSDVASDEKVKKLVANNDNQQDRIDELEKQIANLKNAASNGYAVGSGSGDPMQNGASLGRAIARAANGPASVPSVADRARLREVQSRVPMARFDGSYQPPTASFPGVSGQQQIAAPPTASYPNYSPPTARFPNVTSGAAAPAAMSAARPAATEVPAATMAPTEEIPMTVGSADPGTWGGVDMAALDEAHRREADAAYYGVY